jgi:hypothetical protein
VTTGKKDMGDNSIYFKGKETKNNYEEDLSNGIDKL